ncbi:MAG: matrixin family metalloprotease [Gallionella sp.]
MNETTKIQPRKFRKVLCCALGLMGVMNGGDAQCYDARPDPMVPGNVVNPATSSDALMLADAAAKTITSEIVRKIERQFKNFCEPSENPSVETRKAHLGGLSPGFSVVNALKVRYGIEVAGEVKAVITRQPVHGKIAMIGFSTQSFPGLSLEEFQYTPEKDFLGENKAVIEVIANGQKFRLSYTIKVVHGGFNDACVPPGADRGAYTTEVQIAIEDLQFLQDANAPESTTSWQSLFALNEQIINSINLSFADLATGAVGQTIGEGLNATITLDTNAAGNGWFVDSTPSDNSEYLPTSNPNEWIAKAGTAAAGKMDMLSVLLHEYGHALGIDHSSNPNDFMATTLTAGVRRLPSAAEMALRQPLVGQAKATLTNGSLNAADGWRTQGSVTRAHKREQGQT